MRLPRLALLLALALTGGTALAEGRFQLVETPPTETTLDHPDIPNATDVWVEMIDGAKTSIDLSEFYVSSQANSRLEQVIAALGRAGERGVKIRFLVDANFRGSNQQDLDRISKMKGVELRRIDFDSLAGGVQHAKYFLVDGREAFVGSQNFDWRSLEHVYELGVRTDEPPLIGVLSDVFETDWALAGGAPRGARTHTSTATFPDEIGAGKERLLVTPALSPKGLLPDEALYDLPQIVALVDGAKSSVRVQLMNYKAADGKAYWGTLDEALQRAAKRGVQVQLMVADWSKKPGTIDGMQRLEALDNVDVKMVTIPQHSGGFIPFARVIHAKYMVVDGTRAWIGTSNWDYGYFNETRGVGFVVDGPSFAADLDRLFHELWSGPYAEEVDPKKTYTPPRIAE